MCSGEVAEFYSHLCPAGVYERVGDALRLNPPNCVDCKATDVLGPRWTPREGGSGPKVSCDVTLATVRLSRANPPCQIPPLYRF